MLYVVPPATLHSAYLHHTVAYLHHNVARPNSWPCPRYAPIHSRYGQSLIADPWGTVLDACPLEGEGFAIADLSKEFIGDVRERIPLRTDAREVTAAP